MPKFYSFSEASADHSNEDCFAVEHFSGGCIGAVADGQGGRPGGAFASSLACSSFLTAIRSSGDAAFNTPSFWRNVFQSVDRKIESDPDAGFTTLAAFWIKGGNIFGASCGDSAIFLSNSNMQFVEVTTNQQKNPQIGSGMTSCTFFNSPLAEPWSVLAASDGVWKYIGREKLRSLMVSTKGADLSSALRSAGRLPGSGTFQDDFTFLSVESDD